MPRLTKRAQQLVQLLSEELDRNPSGPWTVLMSGHSLAGSAAWEWRIDLGEGQDEDWYVSNPDTNRADVIPITKVR